MFLKTNDLHLNFFENLAYGSKKVRFLTKNLKILRVI